VKRYQSMLFVRKQLVSSKRSLVQAVRVGRVTVLLMCLLFACGTASAMTELGRWRPPVESHHIAVNGTWLYMGSGRTLYVVDTSNPANIRTVATLNLTPWFNMSNIHDIKYANGNVFVLSIHAHLALINVANPRTPRVVSAVRYGNDAMVATGGGRSVSVRDSRVYISQTYPTTGNYKINVVDVSNPANQRRLGGVSPQHSPNVAIPIGQRLYAGMRFGNGLQVYDLSNPNWPRFLGASTFGLYPSPTVHDIIAMGRYMLLATSSGLLSVDASNPSNMRLKGRISGESFRVAAVSDRVCAIAHDNGVALVGVNNDGSLTVIDRESIYANRVVYANGRLYTASSRAHRPPLVVFDPLPPPLPILPTGTLALGNRRPSFSWTGTVGAAWYQLWINRNGQAYQTPWVRDATSWIPSNELIGGTYQWRVRGWGPVTGYGSWSRMASFTVPAILPGVLTVNAPTGVQTTHDLTYRWQKDANALWYRLWVGRTGAGAWHDRWFALTGTGEAAVTPGGSHPGVAKPVLTAPSGMISGNRPTFQWAGGRCSWWVRPWARDGYGPWSGPGNFSIPYPAGTWVRVYASRGNQMVIDEWTTSGSLRSPVDLQSGAHRWWLGVWDAAARRTIWSDRMDFTVP